jgi:GNAT superfamily N-acetyltransferase
MVIREALPSELPEVGEIRIAAYVADGFLSPGSDYAPALRALGADGAGRVLVAADGDQILGTVTLQSWPEGGDLVSRAGDAEIRALAVRPEARGAGLGKQLLAAVIDLAVAEGAERLLLLTQPDMKVAHHLYEETGFRRLPELDWSPRPGLILLAYGLILRPGPRELP